MQTVSSFMARQAGRATAAFAPGTDPVDDLLYQPADTSSGLKAARAGTSAISAFSNLAMSFRQAGSYDAAARGEELASRAEYVQAQQRSTAIAEAYRATVGAQTVQAAANGVDIASGSVKAARRDAQGQADRQLSIIRTNADTAARLRLARAAAYRAASSTAKATGFFNLFDDAAKIGAQFMGAGG